jgi:signal peptidase I
MESFGPALERLRQIPPRTLWRLLSSSYLTTVGNSMFPLLHPGDVLLFDRLAYVKKHPSRGDLIVFHHASAPSGRMIKLVAGLAGEQVEVRNDRLWIDDRELIFPRPIVGSLPGRWAVGPDELFVLSAAVAVGTDSRSFGPVNRNAVLGRAWFVLPPSPRAGPIVGTELSLG